MKSLDGVEDDAIEEGLCAYKAELEALNSFVEAHGLFTDDEEFSVL